MVEIISFRKVDHWYWMGKHGAISWRPTRGTADPERAQTGWSHWRVRPLPQWQLSHSPIMRGHGGRRSCPLSCSSSGSMNSFGDWGCTGFNIFAIKLMHMDANSWTYNPLTMHTESSVCDWALAVSISLWEAVFEKWQVEVGGEDFIS